MSLISRFPARYTPRELQRELLDEIESKIKSGYKKIILSAPTGVGKSLIAVTLAEHLQKSFIVTASKQLQDQYSRDLPALKPVKGKSNFACFKLMKAERVSNRTKALSEGLTCDRGVCTVQKVTDGVKKTETCEFKPKIRDVEGGARDESACLYYLQKYTALVSAHSLWNYSAYFQTLRYNRETFAPYLDRPLAVFDEAHRIEDQIINFIGVDITRRGMDDCGLELKSYDMEDIDSLIGLLDDMSKSYASRLGEAESNPDLNPEIVDRLESRYKQASESRVELLKNRDNFVINQPETDVNGFRSLSIRPIDISGYVEEFFGTEYQMFMSATLERDGFCENMGFDVDDVCVVDTQRSPFPLDSRRVHLMNVRYLSSKSTESDRAAVIAAINNIMSRHADERGLILTSSIKWCREIMEGLDEYNRPRVRMCHSRNPDGRTQDEILDEHAGTRGSVLLSSSLWEGVDLKDELSRFQIIAKVPYPNLGERRVAEKMRRFPLWYRSQTLMKLLQGLGRSVRGEGDWAKTYVLDAAASRMLAGMRDRVPHAYYDTFGWD